MIPEIAIKYFIDTIIKIVSDDYLANVKEVAIDGVTTVDYTDTLIYYILFGADDGIRMDEDSIINNYNIDMVKQAVELFVNRDNKDSRKIRSVVMFSPDMMRNPCIHITSPSENVVERMITDDLYFDESDGGYSGFNYNLDAGYMLLITSTNKNDVIIIYYILIHMILSCYDTLLIKIQFDDVEISGQEVRLANPNISPDGLYSKGIMIKTHRSVKTRSIKAITDKIKDIKIKSMTMYDSRDVDDEEDEESPEEDDAPEDDGV